jgi:FMN hydrolase / 5-amino-6-(5-phospho-D-ribitylamino)uracil phosphatase
VNARGAAVLMDFGGTLDADGVRWAVRFHTAYARVGGTLSLRAFEPIFRESDRALAQLPHVRRMGFRAMIDAQAALLRALLPDGDSVDTGRMAELFHAEALRTVARNRAALDSLRGCSSLAVISNFTGNLEPCLSELGIRDYFDVVTDSAIHGVTKPDPMLILHTLHALGATAQGAWIIGDNIEADIRPARALGLQTCWLAPAGRPAPANCPPTARANRFTDVPAIVGCTA